MRWSSKFLTSRFGRRIFLLFSLCALLPIGALALISYVSVRRELRVQAQTRLSDSAKSMSMGVWERLTILDSELQVIAYELDAAFDANAHRGRSILGTRLAARFRNIIVESETDPSRVIQGTRFEVVPPALDESAHLDSSQPLLRLGGASRNGEARALLGRRIDSLPSGPAVVWGEIEPAFLWWGGPLENTLPARMELVVLDESNREPVFASRDELTILVDEFGRLISTGSRGEITFESEGEPYMAHYRVVNLRPAFHYPSVTFVVSEPTSVVLRPLAAFRRVFLGVVLATLLVVMLVSLRQIQRSLVPLERLQEGTRKLAGGETGAIVRVESDDEFADLASSFNSMARSLDRQFATLRSLNQIQQAVLSSLDTDRIISTVLSQFGSIFPCEQVSLCLLKADCDGDAWVYSKGVRSDAKRQVEAVRLSSSEVEMLSSGRQSLELDVATNRPSFLQVASSVPLSKAVAFPAFNSNELVAVLTAGIENESHPDPGAFDQARQLADQVAIALANIRLVQELDDLNWGALSALARAIDVRSHWTMGHTERVTSLAEQIGRFLGLPKERLETLNRAGLLHDIGKIGVPSEILDKPGKLTAEEMDKVREHVRLGARIIEPIPALSGTVPVVLQHHEWFNGQGYPAGLAGEEICLEARILSVADCYDALRSNRPYRSALGHDVVMNHLHEGAGNQFDPRIVEAFCDFMSESRASTRRPAMAAADRRRVAST